MGRIRIVRTLAASGTAVATLIVLGFAAQDLLSYFRTISEGPLFWPWASSSQGVWVLTSGVAEVVAAFGLLLLTIRLLSGSPIRRRRARSIEPASN